MQNMSELIFKIYRKWSFFLEIFVRSAVADLREPVSECRESVTHHTAKLQKYHSNIYEKKEKFKWLKMARILVSISCFSPFCLTL